MDGMAATDMLGMRWGMQLEAMRKKWGGAGAVMYSVGSNVSAIDNKGKMTPPAIAHAAITTAIEVAKRADAVILGLGLCGDNYGGSWSVGAVTASVSLARTPLHRSIDLRVRVQIIRHARTHSVVKYQSCMF